MPFSVRVTSAERFAASASGTANIDIYTEHGHPFKAGDKVNLYGLTATSGTVGFSDGNPYTVANAGSASSTTLIGGVWTITSFKGLSLKQTVPANYAGATGATLISIGSGAVVGNSLNTFRVTTSSPHNLPVGLEGNSIGLVGITGLTTSDLSQLNRNGLPSKIISNTVIEFKSKPVATWTGVVWTSGSVYFAPTAAVVSSADGLNAYGGQAGALTWGPPSQAAVKRNLVEGDAIYYCQQLVANFMALDYSLQRLCFPFDTSKITTTRVPAQVNISQAPATWRSVLDSLVETYGGADAKKRRYWIDADGIFNYQILDDTKPATATAPYKINVSGLGTPNSTTAPTIAPFQLSLSVDHDTTKRALFSTSASDGTPISDFVRYDSPDALGTAATRSGAPTFDAMVEYPTGTSASITSRQVAAKSYFLERALPVQSGQFTIRGAGTAAWNNLGFTSGYATITSPTSVTVPLIGAYSSGGTDRQVTATDFVNLAVGMQVVVSGWTTTLFTNGSNWNGTATITDFGRARLTSWDTGLPFQYAGTASLPAAAGPYIGRDSGFAQAVISGLFVRTGTAPNQIVTVTLPRRHGIATNASVTVSGLTGTAGTSMNGTVTATVVDDYSFTYPSTGTNGTASGSATLSSITSVPNWAPGQWVDITAPDFGLSGLYRVEQVDWRLEPGSFQQVITITFNRRNTKLLTRILREKG